MTLQEIHAEIKRIVPESGVVKVAHEYVNNICGESWSCSVYPKSKYESLGESIIFVYGSRTPDALIENVIFNYSKLDMTAKKLEQIDKLKAQLAELEEV